MDSSQLDTVPETIEHRGLTFHRIGSQLRWDHVFKDAEGKDCVLVTVKKIGLKYEASGHYLRPLEQITHDVTHRAFDGAVDPVLQQVVEVLTLRRNQMTYLVEAITQLGI
jgi:hypothetical protein